MAKKIINILGFCLSIVGFAFLLYVIIVILTNTFSQYVIAKNLSAPGTFLGIIGFILSIVGLCLRGNKALGILGIIFGVIAAASPIIILLFGNYHISSMF